MRAPVPLGTTIGANAAIKGSTSYPTDDGKTTQRTTCGAKSNIFEKNWKKRMNWCAFTDEEQTISGVCCIRRDVPTSIAIRSELRSAGTDILRSTECP